MNRVVFSLHKIKRQAFFGTPGNIFVIEKCTTPKLMLKIRHNFLGHPVQGPKFSRADLVGLACTSQLRV